MGWQLDGEGVGGWICELWLFENHSNFCPRFSPKHLHLISCKMNNSRRRSASPANNGPNSRRTRPGSNIPGWIPRNFLVYGVVVRDSSNNNNNNRNLSFFFAYPSKH